MKSESDVPVARSALAMLSVDGQRARPSPVTRLDLLNEVGSSPALRARPEAEREWLLARASIAAHIRSWESIRYSLFAAMQPDGMAIKGNYSFLASGQK